MQAPSHQLPRVCVIAHTVHAGNDDVHARDTMHIHKGSPIHLHGYVCKAIDTFQQRAYRKACRSES